MGDSKAVTEKAPSPEKKPGGFIPLAPLFSLISKQGLSSLCSLSSYSCHKRFLSAAFKCCRTCRNARNARNSFQKFCIIYRKPTVMTRDPLLSPEFFKPGSVFPQLCCSLTFLTDLCPISWAMVTPRSKPVSWVIMQLQEDEQTPPNWVTPRSSLFPSGNSRSNLK